jgi:hypothetical protein
MRDVKSSLARVLRLAGEYDLTRKNEIVELFATLDGDSSVQIDLSDVTYIDSTILRELAMATSKWASDQTCRRKWAGRTCLKNREIRQAVRYCRIVLAVLKRGS